MSTQHQDTETLFHITYECTDCDIEWTDVWSCACDDECPGCGDAIEARDYIELEPEPTGIFAMTQAAAA